MRERPTEIKIGANDYVIRWFDRVDEGATGSLGYCRHDELVIGLSVRLSNAKILETLLHELAHALHYLFSLHDQALTQERYCGSLSCGMAMLMRDNPELFLWLNTLATTGDNKG